VRSDRLRFATGLLALLVWLAALPVRANDAIEVRSAQIKVHGNVVKFTVRAYFPVDEQMRAALAAGATVNLDVQAEIDRKRSYWFDDRVLDASVQRELSWNALSQRYVLKNSGNIAQQTFATVEEALAAAGAVDDWAVRLDAPLDPDKTYEVGVRARLRLGHAPSGLRELTFWTRYWNRSEWYSWVLSH
jgi:Domain of unknown function (DUF4390)